MKFNSFYFCCKIFNDNSIIGLIDKIQIVQDINKKFKNYTTYTLFKKTKYDLNAFHCCLANLWHILNSERGIKEYYEGIKKIFSDVIGFLNVYCQKIFELA